MTTRNRWLAPVAAVLVIVIVATIIIVGDNDRHRVDPGPTRPISAVQASFQPLTGLRTSAPTVVSGVIVNTTSDPSPISVAIADLPDGASIQQVLPTASAPENGTYWACTSSTCALVAATDGQATLASGGSAQMTLVLQTPSTVPIDATVTVTVNDRPAITVPLSLGDGRPPVADVAMTLALSGPSILLSGTTATYEVGVANLATEPTASATVDLDTAGFAGVTFAASGTDWNCTLLQCTATSPIASFSTLGPIQITATAPEGLATTTATIGASLTGAISGSLISSTSSMQVTQRPNDSKAVSTRLSFSPAAITAPGSAIANVAITPTGRGSISEEVSFRLDVPKGITPDWDSFTTTDAWSCSASTSSCNSTAPLASGVVTLVGVPVSVDDSVHMGTNTVDVVTTVTGANRSTTTSAALVVSPPPVAELRAALAATSSTGGDPELSGDALSFAPGQPRSMQVTVVNNGSVEATAGTRVHVSARPDSDQQLSALGGRGWRCNRSGTARISSSTPIECSSVLADDLQPGQSIDLPFTLKGSGIGSAVWTVGAGFSPKESQQFTSTVRVDVVPDAPMLTTQLVQASPFAVGGSGGLDVEIRNSGTQLATGGVAVISIPRDADVTAIDSGSWDCIDIAPDGANGILTCTTSDVIAGLTDARTISLNLAPREGSRSLTFSAWSTTPNQFSQETGTRADKKTFPVADAIVVDAGQDLTVITPQTTPTGQAIPAVVVLTGDTNMSAARTIRWQQLCTQSATAGCGGTTSPAVTWLGIAPGQVPTTLSARFTAPPISAPTDLFFQLTAYVGTEAITDSVTVHLLPPTGTSPTSGTTPPSPSSGPANAAGTSPSSPSTSAPVATAVTAQIDGSSSVLQVPTEATAQLFGSGTGSGALSYSWNQTAGPTAAIAGTSASQPTLQFVTPLLDPDTDDEMLSFELTVTDSTGATATASTDVQVIWGDDGLLVTIGAGSGTIATSIAAPVTIASTVSSRGTPYSYQWSSDDLDLTSAGSTTSPTLSFTAPDQATTGIVQLDVTDNFGRTATAQVEIVVSALPPGFLPQAFCDALTAISTGQPAVVGGGGSSVTITGGTLTGPATPCSATTTVAITNATATLPGGISLTAITGRLSIAGISIDEATVSAPSSWSLDGLSIGANGLLIPFASSSSLGTPLGTVVATSMPVLDLAQWTGTTTMQFAPDQPGQVLIATIATGPGQGDALTLTGTGVGAQLQMSMNATGLVTIASVDIPVRGGIATNGSAPATFTTSARLSAPTSIGASTTLSSADLAWSPTLTSGAVTLQIGSATGGFSIAGEATVTPTQTSLTVTPGGSSWSPAPGVSPLALGGTGAIGNDSLSLNLQSSPSGPVLVGNDLSLVGIAATVSANCPLDGSQTCAPTVSMTATASSPLIDGTVALSGTFSVASSSATLTGAVPAISVPPITVGSAQLQVMLATGQAPTASATGTASILQSSQTTVVAFGATGTVATSQIGSQAISPTWEIADTIAVATTTSFLFSPPTGPLAGQVSVPVEAQQLTGVGITQIPSAFASGVIPDDITTALASFPITGTISTVQLQAAIPDGWYLTGSDTSGVSLEMQSIGFRVVPSSSSPTISITGTAVLTTASVGGGSGSSAQALTISSGNLTAGSDGGVLSATFVPETSAVSAFGLSGLTVDELTIAANVSSSSSLITMSGSTTVPPSFATAVGLPPGATPTLSATLDADDPCLSIDLASGGGSGVDFGNDGFLIATSAFLVIAPSACTTTGGTAVPQGVSLILDSGFLDVTDPDAPPSVVLTVDPQTASVSDTISGVSIAFGGFSLTSTDISVDTRNGSTSISVSGQGSLAGVETQFSGDVQPPTTPFPALGTLTLTASIPSLTLVDLTVNNLTATISGPSVLGADNSEILATGTSTILGDDVTLRLLGDTTNGSILGFTQKIDRTTYDLGTGSNPDTLETELEIRYTTTPAAGLSINGTDGTLTTQSQTFTDVAVTVDGAMSTLEVKTPVTYIDDDDSRALVSGNYRLSGADIGSYSFSNPSNVHGTISGIPQDVTVNYARSSTGTETGTQSSVITFGVFDSNTQIDLTGVLSTRSSVRSETLSTANAPTVQFRGLEGSMQIDVTDAGQGAELPYSVQATFTTSTSSCSMWSNSPVLKGSFYRTGTTTYFTLSGSVTPILPAEVNISEMSFSQPVVLSNEYLPGSVQSPGSISLTVPIESALYQGWVTISFGMADCSYSISGSVSVIVTGGQAAQELMSVLQPPSGLTINQGQLFGNGGELPPMIAEARQVYAFEARQHAIQQRATGAANARNDATAAQGRAQTAADTAAGQLENARGDVVTASTNYRNALNSLATAETNVDNESTLPFAGESLDNAYAQLRNATAQATATKQALDAATATVERTGAESAQRAQELTQANTELRNRQNEATNEEQQQQASTGAKLLQLSLSITYCATCTEQFTSSISGEAYFDVFIVAGLQFGFEYGDQGVTVQLGVNAGIEWQHSYGSSHIGAFLDASLILSLSTEYSFSNGWQEADLSLQATAQADVYVSTWVFTWTGTLASIDLLGEWFIEPSLSVSGSYDLYFFGLSLSGQWGGNLDT